MFVSIGMLVISILLAIIFSIFFDIKIPKEITGAEFLAGGLIVWVIPIFIMIVLITTLIAKKNKDFESTKVISKMTAFSVFILLLLQVFIISDSSNVSYDMNVVIGVLVGGVAIVLANYMQKTKANIAFGLRLPWTLKDETVWRKSNRFAAKLLMLAGILIISLSFIMPNDLEMIVLTVLLVAVLLSTVFSYVISRKHTV